MNIFLLTSEFPPSFGGGISTYCYHTAHMLVEEGHAVTVVVGGTNLVEPQTISENGDLRVIRFRPGRSDESRTLGAEAQLSYDIANIITELIRKEGPPDVIESQEYLGLPYFLLQRKWSQEPELRDVPVWLTLHTPQFICDAYNQGREFLLPLYWLGEMERFCIKAADGLISPSYYLIEELNRRGELPNLPRFVVRNPYQSANSQNVNSNGQLIAKEIGKSEKELIFLGKLEVRKGVLPLLKQMRTLWESGSNLKLTMIGGDHYYFSRQIWMKEFIQQNFRQYIDNNFLKMEPALPPEQLANRLRQASLVVFPSTFENFPYVVIESMALGLPVLASKSGGQSEIIRDGIDGFLFSHSENSSFQQRLKEALGFNNIISIQSAAQSRIRELCSYDSVYPAKMEAIEHCLSHKGDRRSFPFIRGPIKNYQQIEGAIGQKGLLSVIIPFFNAGQYLPEALNSIDASTWPEKEILIVDDGSNDPESISLLESLVEKSSLRIIRKVKNEGVSRARNIGALEARGEYIAFLDADDTIAPSFYSKAIANLESLDNVSFVGSWARYWGESEGIWVAWNPEPPYILFHNTVVSGSLVFRRKAFINHGMNDPDFEYGWEDYESIVHMIENGVRGIILPEVLLNYRVRSNSRSRQIGRNGYIFLSSQIIARHPAIYQLYGKEMAALLNSNGPGFLFENPSIFYSQVDFVSNTPDDKNIDQTQTSTFPPAPAKTYFYLFIRECLVKIYLHLGGNRNTVLLRLKLLLRKLFLRSQS